MGVSETTLRTLTIASSRHADLGEPTRRLANPRTSGPRGKIVHAAQNRAAKDAAAAPSVTGRRADQLGAGWVAIKECQGVASAGGDSAPGSIGRKWTWTIQAIQCVGDSARRRSTAWRIRITGSARLRPAAIPRLPALAKHASVHPAILPVGLPLDPASVIFSTLSSTLTTKTMSTATAPNPSAGGLKSRANGTVNGNGSGSGSPSEGIETPGFAPNAPPSVVPSSQVTLQSLLYESGAGDGVNGSVDDWPLPEDLDFARPVSELLRKGTQRAHTNAENSDGATALTAGKLEMREYVRWLGLLWRVYE